MNVKLSKAMLGNSSIKQVESPIRRSKSFVQGLLRKQGRGQKQMSSESAPKVLACHVGHSCIHLWPLDDIAVPHLFVSVLGSWRYPEIHLVRKLPPMVWPGSCCAFCPPFLFQLEDFLGVAFNNWTPNQAAKPTKMRKKQANAMLNHDKQPQEQQ